MTSPEKLRRLLIRMLDERLIPLAAHLENPILLMDPANLARQQYQFSLHSGPPLNDLKHSRSPLYLNQWDEQRVHAVRYPCLVAVVEGEIDWRIGITRSALKRDEINWKDNDYLTIPITEGKFFLMPPGVPYSSGEGLHWERPLPREQPAILLWMLVLPSGFMCHYCRSTAQDHKSHPQFFVPNQQIHPLIKMLEDELTHHQAGSEIIAKAHLQAILNYASRGLQSNLTIAPIMADAALFQVNHETNSPQQDAVQRAKSYIDSHLQSPLAPASIAAQAYLSVRQLDRYFQRDLGMSVADYVASRRVEMARALLQDTDLPISQIGQIVGYRNSSSFTQIFKRKTGMAPSALRTINKSRKKV